MLSAAFHVRPIGGLLSLPFSRMDESPFLEKGIATDDLILAIVKIQEQKNTRLCYYNVLFGEGGDFSFISF